jgi:hypothetical protein
MTNRSPSWVPVPVQRVTNYLIPLSHLIFDLDVGVGEGSAEHADVLLEPFGATNILGHGRIVVYVVGGEDLVG